MSLSRRRFTAVTGGALAALAVAPACAAQSFVTDPGGRLTTRPKTGVKTTASGRAPLGMGGTRDGLLQVPDKIPNGPMPLFVLLHGASSSGERQLNRFGSIPSEAGVAVLALDSRDITWDAIRGGFGRDVEFLNRALAKVFGLVDVNPDRLAIGGFSDGATYGLSLGMINGDLFKRIIAFSPGFIVSGEEHGKPRIFVSHGRSDDILPINQCSRVIVPELKRRGLDVTYKEFDGVHEAPAPIVRDAMQWLVS